MFRLNILAMMDAPLDERLGEIAFDLFERYALLAPIGKFFRPDATDYRVLDLGGHTPALWSGFSSLAGALIPDAHIAIVDMQANGNLPSYVQASGLQLPFADQTFDLVCSLDTLEHIAPQCRAAFLAELLRVTRDGLYLAFPFDSPSNRWAESLLLGYADAALHDSIPQLEEHRRYGLPQREVINSWLSRCPYARIEFEQGNTDVWLLMMLTYHSLRRTGDDFVQQLNRRFNYAYAAQDWAPPGYRVGYLLSKRRSIDDLIGLRASFMRVDDRADSQSVLALCQFFLTIAQNARVTADKDRHIRNLESQLASTENDRDRLADNVVRLETALRETARDITAQVGRLQKQVESQVRLDDRLRDLEIGLATNRRATQGIYDSRIWKTLTGLGGLALRFAGRSPQVKRAWGIGTRNLKQAPVSREPAVASSEFMALICDYPEPGAAFSGRDVVEVRGWALAQSGIERVVVQIDAADPVAASYGILRQDVANTHRQIAGAEHCGYRFFWDPAGLPDGGHRVRVTALARSGECREITRDLRIDRDSAQGYELWIARYEPGPDGLRQMREQAENFALQPLISVVVPVFNTPVDLLRRCIESVRNQIYPHWELCLADDGSRDSAVAALIKDLARRDCRIRAVTQPENGGISRATNAALQLARGEYVAFLDHDDELAPFALREVARVINESPEIELFYSDEDKIDEHGRRFEPFCKPDWSPDLFLSCNYVCHLAVLKRSLMDRLGGFDPNYDGAQDYDYLLRAAEVAAKINRIPKILYHWRAIPGSTAQAAMAKPAASDAGRRALAAYLGRLAPGATVEQVKPCRYRVRYALTGNPRVSILMPTAGHLNLFRTAIEDVLDKTTYSNYEIVLIDNSRSSRVEEYAVRLAARQAPMRHFDWRGKPFNFSAMNNEAARASDSPYILFLNDDITIITPEWLDAMLEHAQRPEIGAVGAQLWYPDDVIQHAGVVMGLYGNCSHAFKNQPADRSYYFDFPDLIRNCSAVTAACLLIGRAKFFQAGGFDEENLPVAFQDVDLCLKLLELGYRNLYTPYARLYHYESASKTDHDRVPDPAEDLFMKKKWAAIIADDPYYNPNLARRKEDFSLAME